MKIFQWLAKLNPLRTKPAPPSAGLRCSCCLHHIHKGERFVIEAARHRDCRDPKLTGQGRLFDPVPKMINGEQVNVAPAASMGTELIAPLPAGLPKSLRTLIYEAGLRQREDEYQNRPQPLAAPSSWPNFPQGGAIDEN